MSVPFTNFPQSFFFLLAIHCPRPCRPIKCSLCGSNQHTRGRCLQNEKEQRNDDRQANGVLQVEAYVYRMINRYRVVFAKRLAELGCTNVLKTDIREVSDSVPVVSRPYRTSQSDRKIHSSKLKE